MSSISFSNFSRKPSVQLINKTSSTLQNTQVRGVCSIPSFASKVLIHGLPKGCEKEMCLVRPLVNEPLKTVRDQLNNLGPEIRRMLPVDPKMIAKQLGELRETLGYQEKEEKTLTLNELSKDLQMVDELTRIPLPKPPLEISKERVSSTMTFEQLIKEC